MIYLVGGSGFIGTRLAKLLTTKNETFVIVDKVKSRVFPEKSIIADVRSQKELTNTITDDGVIINLAAEHRDDVSPRSLYDEVNVNGAVNICEVAMKRNTKKIVFISSVAVYGFAPLGTNENGEIKPFNDYGRTKAEAEEVYKKWQKEKAGERTLVIVRPTVVFGEQNRGNVYNLLKQISSGKFIMVGKGTNRKSMAYVENVAAFLVYATGINGGTQIFNYVDKPDFNMNELNKKVREIMGKRNGQLLRLPFVIGLIGGYVFDMAAFITRKKLPISSIRVRKFCTNSVYETSVDKTSFRRPVSLEEAIIRTIKYEFFECKKSDFLFESE